MWDYRRPAIDTVLRAAIRMLNKYAVDLDPRR
jgi:hypothetical protein